MESIQKYTSPQFSTGIDTLLVGNAVWFKGKDVASALEYRDTDQALRKNVCDDDKLPLNDLLSNPVSGTGYRGNAKQAMFINESGLYSLILGSKKEEAKAFKKWVTSEVLPSIRKTGSYTHTKAIKAPQMSILNETDLHKKVVDFIRKYYPHAILVAGLGELQDTSNKRCDAYYKGYKGGQPDILILNKHKYFNGFAIEFKTPTGRGVLSDNQKAFIGGLQDNNYKTLISNDYDEILVQLVDYFADIRLSCQQCGCKRGFRCLESLQNHITKFHKC